MANYSDYDYERTCYEFNEHKDSEKMYEIRNLISSYFINSKDEYPDDKQIMESIIKLFNTCGTGKSINRCIECGIDMGECNPRQYCGKTYCNNS